ncbi:MAG: ABC transporter permease [Phycisphaeraceae bacterium]|nr:ABC transporter permease [Phycisphaeraceae bacterium]
MKHIATLVKKDLQRDARHPWGLIIFMLIPVMTAVIMSLVFSPKNDIQENIRVRIALLDFDDDFLGGLMRSMSQQGRLGENLVLQFVDTEAQGLKLVEKRKVSAFVILPKDLTQNILDLKATSLTLYKNPAEAILPAIVEEAINTLCIGISQAVVLLETEIKSIRDMADLDEIPNPLLVGMVAAQSTQRLKKVEPYFLPPLVQFNSLEAADYQSMAPAEPEPNPEGQP